MNIILSLLFLFVFMAITIVLSNGDLFSPSVLTSVSYFLGIAFVFVNSDITSFDISGETAALMVLSVVLFLVGYYSVQVAYPKNESVKISLPYFDIPRWLTYGIILLEIITIVHVILTYRAIVGVGIGNLGSLIYHGSYRSTYGERTGSSIWGIFSLFTYSAQYLFTYQLITDKDSFRSSSKYTKTLWMVGTALSLFERVLSGGRIWLILYLLFVLLTNHMLNFQYKERKNFASQLKEIAKIFAYAAIFIIIFYFIGYTIKHQSQFDPMRLFYSYTGASIAVFDKTKGLYSSHGVFSSVVFRNFFALLKHIIKEIPEINIPDFGTFANINGTVSNLVPAFGWYYHDFGFWGCLLMHILLGTFSSFLYSYITYHDISFIFYFFYFYIIQALALQFITEGVFTNVLSISFLVPLFGLWIVQKLNKVRFVVNRW